MRRILLIAGILTTFNIFAQINYSFDPEHYCSRIPPTGSIDQFSYRNDWQSDLLHAYDVHFYFLNIEVSHTSVHVGGTVEIHGKVVVPVLDTFAFELITQHNISSIIFNNVSYSNFNRDGDNVLVAVSPLSEGDNFIARISYSGTPPTGGFFAGVTNATSYTWQKSVTWSLSAPYAAKEWFPCKQILTDKADSVWVFLTVPAGTMAASQGLLTNITPMPDQRNRFEWKSNYPIAFYLISFAVADYQEYNTYAFPEAMQGDSLLIQNFVYNHPDYLTYNQQKLDDIAEILEVYSDLFTLYPFWQEKYGHALTQLGGGMENQTMTTIGNFNFDLVAHELGHMWFGDNVTCASWSDVWINEGFATYTNYLAQEKIKGWASGQSFIIATQNNVMKKTGGSVYIPPSEIGPDNITRIFDGRLTYDKGAAIIHVLRHEINNDDIFFEILQAFQTDFADSTATGEDFKQIASEISGLDLTQFFDQWYYGEGYPNYEIVWNVEGDMFTMDVTQTPSSSTPLFEMTMSYRLNFADGSNEIIRLYQDANFKHFEVPVSQPVVSIQVDPDNWTFEKVISISTGLAKNLNPAYFSFTPNPASDIVTVFSPFVEKNYLQIDVCDLSGKSIRKYHITQNPQQINVQGLKKGVYLLNMTNATQSWTRKLIKN
ncbi:MAG: T9SS type A sorting domain-containing protein [Bacteroidales bacterium]|nr:T9SS type A sorting domain-containing protein [Bacteroidales bacterium]